MYRQNRNKTQKINALLVLSKISFVPSNCASFLDLVLHQNHNDIAGVLILQNSVISKIPLIVQLYILGCRNTAWTYVRNMLLLPARSQEQLCQKHQIPVLKAKSVNDHRIVQWMKQHNVHLIINMRGMSIYKKEILSYPRYGCVNIHHGILPTYRGRYCDLYALSENRPAGFSIHKITETLDGGGIYYTRQLSKIGEHNYMRYLSRITPYEAYAVSWLLRYIRNHSALPPENVDKNANILYSRTPTKRQIQDMIRRGMIL